MICCAMVTAATAGCTRENPAFDTGDVAGSETGSSDTLDERDLPSESGEESTALCELEGGTDMTIKVPQPCGETNDVEGLYEHYFHVVEAVDSTLSVQFCTAGCAECEPLAGDLLLSPLPVAELAAPGACLLMKGRRLGTGDDCNYHAISLQDVTAGGAMLVLARRTDLLELPPIETNTGLFGWEPTLVVHETCDCAETPDSCCDGQAPTLYGYQVNGPDLVPVGITAPVVLGQRAYDFWAFNAFQSGECQAPIDVSWALVAAN
jgi:hypothetical protein